MNLLKHYDFTRMTTLHPDWNVRVGEKWSNNELQHYVNDEQHIAFDNGLILRATSDGNVIESARIDTKDNFFYTYGKIEVTAKLPAGRGTWPAIWMMPNEQLYGHWPKSGEIDIVEYAANNKDKLFFCLHTEMYNHRRPDEQYYTADIFHNIADDFHTFGLLWEEHRIVYYVDDQVVATYHRGENGKDASHKGWPFTNDYYIILNLAIGGTFGGPVDPTMFPQEFIIKEVKVYQ